MCHWRVGYAVHTYSDDSFALCKSLPSDQVRRCSGVYQWEKCRWLLRSGIGSNTKVVLGLWFTNNTPHRGRPKQIAFQGLANVSLTCRICSLYVQSRFIRTVLESAIWPSKAMPGGVRVWVGEVPTATQVRDWKQYESGSWSLVFA